MTGSGFPALRRKAAGKSSGSIHDVSPMNPPRFDPPHPLLGVSIAVFREGRVLLATRTKPPFAGVFSLPGGRVEAGESLRAAALRELDEEVAVKARIVAFNRAVEMIAPENGGDLRRHYVILAFVGAWISGEGRPGPEAGEVLWAEPRQLAHLQTSPHLLTVVDSAREILSRQSPNLSERSCG
jgi:8-oxo-dGTP diphosphatase